MPGGEGYGVCGVTGEGITEAKDRPAAGTGHHQSRLGPQTERQANPPQAALDARADPHRKATRGVGRFVAQGFLLELLRSRPLGG